jgi:oxaloacetate decarboxylase gamma subunit
MLDLLGEGLEVAFFGMTAVFVLLACLVLAVQGMSRLALRIEPCPAPSPAPSAHSGDGDEAELTVAVSAAIHAYRKGRRG